MIEILNYKPINQNSLVAKFAIKVPKWGNFVIRELSLFKKGDTHRWINFPSRSYEENGQKKYFHFCNFEDKDTKDAFEKKVLQSIDAYLIANPQPPQDIVKEFPLFENKEIGEVPF